MKNLLIFLILFVLLAAVGCGGKTSETTSLSTSSTSSPALSTPLAPILTNSITASGTTTTTTTSTLISTTSPTETETTTAPVTSTSAVAIELTSNKAKVNFPDEVVFSVNVKGITNISSIVLQYGSDKRSLVSEINSVEPEYTEGTDIAASWSWEMKKTGSLPPGATIRWWWEVEDEEGNRTTTPEKTIAYEDTRFQWDKKEFPDFDIYWHDQSIWLIDELLNDVQSNLSRIQLDVVIPGERKPKVFIYTSSAELKDAVLFEQEWTGALAFSEYNIILSAVNVASLDWAKMALPHEITHLMVREATFGPFGDIPVWLNEGMAMYSESQLPDYMQVRLDQSVTENTLISLRSLSSGFPADPDSAYLAYAESFSVVNYLIETYGWEKMRQLIATFKDGATYDKALLQVYLFDLDGLENEWRLSLGASVS